MEILESHIIRGTWLHFRRSTSAVPDVTGIEKSIVSYSSRSSALDMSVYRVWSLCRSWTLGGRMVVSSFLILRLLVLYKFSQAIQTQSSVRQLNLQGCVPGQESAIL